MPLNKRFRTQNVDFLGTLSTLLRDLQGYSTLAHELIQNADDVKDETGSPGATEIIFDICDDALYVRNDGVFRVDDFARMEMIAGQHKRNELNTTGAFGIGFLSVYQLTDTPEIFSSGLHWRFVPTKYPENIEEEDYETEGTLFRLPYAIDAASEVRLKLHQEAFDKSRLDELQDTIAETISFAALFLKNLTSLQVKRSGVTIKHVVREEADGLLRIKENDRETIWYLVEGDFDDEAERLRAVYPHQIEEKRHSKVVLAISEKVLDDARLFAVLPTNSKTSLPFHINADFFPHSDRKHIIFEKDYQSEWNRAAVRAAGEIIRHRLDSIKTYFGHVWFWNFLKQFEASGTKAETGELDTVFLELWHGTRDAAKTLRIIFTSNGHWVEPHEARILQSDEELIASTIFEQLEINVVHPELRPHYNLLREFETSLLSVEDIVDALKSNGLDKPQPLSDAPDCLTTVENWRKLWSAIDTILSRSSQRRQIEEDRLKTCSIFLNSNNMLVLASDVYIEDFQDERTRQLFGWVNWIADGEANDVVPGRLAQPFNLSSAVYELGKKDDLEELWQAGELDLPALFRWFYARFGEFQRYSGSLQARFTNLPIFPVSGQLQALTSDLYIPSGFSDPIGLSTLIDVQALGNRKDILLDLGIRELDLLNYVRYEVPKRFTPKLDLTWDQLRNLVKLLSNHLGTFRDQPQIHEILSPLPLIECIDEFCRPASIVYLDEDIRLLLGDETLIAVPSASEAIKELYLWLGVAQKPKTKDLIARIKELITATEDYGNSVALLTEIFEHLANRDLDEQTQRELRSIAWLPGRQQDASLPYRWFKPANIYSTFQNYLFSSSDAVFLDFDRPLQNEYSTFLDQLGITAVPSVEFVLQHLRNYVAAKKPVNMEVYGFLDRAIQDPKASKDWVQTLRGQRCIWLKTFYVAPNFVFWKEHPFGDLRGSLDASWGQYSSLLKELGVREQPAFSDYCSVISEIEVTFSDRPLEEWVKQIVIRCWKDFSEDLERDELSKEELSNALANRKTIPNGDNFLTEPNALLFEDRVDIAKKFDEALRVNIIPRLEGAWRAMEAAGVRLLSETISTQIVEASDPITDVAQLHNIQDRTLLFKRILDAEAGPISHEAINAFFDEFEVKRVRELAVQYKLPLYGGVLTQVERSMAVWDSDERILFFVGEKPDVLIDIARELALALYPSGNLSSCVKDILSAATPQDADLLLDRLGYAPIHSEYDTEIHKVPDEQSADLNPDESYDLDNEEGILSADAEQTDHGKANDIASNRAAQDDKTSHSQSPTSETEDNEEHLLQTDVNSGWTLATQRPNPNPLDVPSQPPNDIDGKQRTTAANLGRVTGDSRSSQGKHKWRGPKRPERKTRSKNRGKLRSYVLSDPLDDDGEIDHEAAERRSEVDLAGIQRVLEYEHLNGRTPTEMFHHNVGFDVKSIDAEDEIRYIEVKSLSGDWDSFNPAALSKAQFDAAREIGNAFWLYVVERAIRPDFRIFCIPDPARRVNQYLFDDGWQALEES